MINTTDMVISIIHNLHYEDFFGILIFKKFKKMPLEKWQRFCSGLNALMQGNVSIMRPP